MAAAPVQDVSCVERLGGGWVDSSDGVGLYSVIGFTQIGVPQCCHDLVTCIWEMQSVV